MPYVSTFELTVRSYELDSYNHVNNAVYIQWLEHGRSKLLEDHGLNYTSIVDAWNVRFMTVRTEIDYRAQLHIGDNITVRTSVARVGNTSVGIRHTIHRTKDDQEQLAAEANVVIVFTDTKSNSPTPVPEEFKRLYA